MGMTWKVSRAFRMYWYLPSSTRINAPEIPGRIMAQMATAPLMNRNHSASGVCEGVIPTSR